MKAEAGTGRWIPGTATERRFLWVLVALAAVLRFAPFSTLSYAHDELSALIRLYPSLGDTIARGVVGVDTHPPGVQVFLWAWTRLGGLGEVWVKGPFILASLGAVLFLYRIAFRLAGGSVALVFTAVLATLQYTVLYGQLARPYAFGLLTTAWMLDRLLVYRDTGRRGALVGMATAAALSAYLHHIALLQALLIGATGLLLITREQRKAYLLAGVAAVLLYLPNGPLLLKQFAWKGLDEWLPPPTLCWFVEHARFVTHWSTVFGVVLAAVVLFAVVRGVRGKAFTRELLVIGVLCGLLPYFVIFFYSVWRAPVLQHSVVLFAFPYVLLCGLAGLKGLRSRAVLATAGGLAVLATITLITTRKHFALNDRAHNRYDAIAHGILEANAAGIPALVDAPAHMLRFTFQRWYTTDLHAYIDISGLDAQALDRVLDSLKADRIFLGVTLQAMEQRTARVRQRFPFLLARHDMAEGQAFLLSARPDPRASDDAVFTSVCAAQAVKGPGWTIDPDLPMRADTTTGLRSWDMGGVEFGIAFEASLDTLELGPNDVIEARLDLERPEQGLTMVLEVKHGDEVMSYHTSLDGGTVPIAAFCLAEVRAPLRELRLNAYVWNRDLREARITAVKVTVRRGNPVRYAWLGPLRGAWGYR